MAQPTIPVDHIRVYDRPGPAWRILLYVFGVTGSYSHGTFENPVTTIPMASAVVDDFGQLVLVTPWH